MNPSSPDPVSRYLKPGDVARMLNVSRRTVANWQSRRVIPFVRVGRVVLFRRDEVEAALEHFRVEKISFVPSRDFSVASRIRRRKEVNSRGDTNEKSETNVPSDAQPTT